MIADAPGDYVKSASRRARRKVSTQGIVEASGRAGDLNLYANGWNHLGEEYLKRGELSLAEAPLLEAYRIRKLNHLALDVSYRSLGRLRLEQGDLTSAAALLDSAVELSARPQGRIPTWDTYHYRGRVLHVRRMCPETYMQDPVIALSSWRARLATESCQNRRNSALALRAG